MSRIEIKFNALRRRSEKALIVYLTAGDPSLEMTEEIVLGLDAAGVDVIEIGVPFSDPTADGPTIQAASRRALENGVTLSNTLDMIEALRKRSEIPIVLFGYYNPILAFGNERLAGRARDVGVDGVLVVDLPPEESAELRRYTDPSGIDFISLIAPTTDGERIRKIVREARGFLYYVSILGVTGTARPRVRDVKTDVARIRQMTDLPLVVGFGISTPQQAREIAPWADGIVGGSAFVRMIDEHRERPDLVDMVSGRATQFKSQIQDRDGCVCYGDHT
jgi:tryptophan synthase alpha chain